MYPITRILLICTAIASIGLASGCTATNTSAMLEDAAKQGAAEADAVAGLEGQAGTEDDAAEETIADAGRDAAEAEEIKLAAAAEPAINSYAGATTVAPAVSLIADIKSGQVAARSPELDRLIAAYANHYDVPEELVRRVVKRESTFNPAARNGPYWGLMQILPATARTMGHRGPPQELLDAETNLKYAVRYLRGAYLVAGGNHDQAVRFYARGYYYDAKAKGLLEATGLGKDRRRVASN